MLVLPRRCCIRAIWFLVWFLLYSAQCVHSSQLNLELWYAHLIWISFRTSKAGRVVFSFPATKYAFGLAPYTYPSFACWTFMGFNSFWIDAVEGPYPLISGPNPSVQFLIFSSLPVLMSFLSHVGCSLDILLMRYTMTYFVACNGVKVTVRAICPFFRKNETLFEHRQVFILTHIWCRGVRFVEWGFSFPLRGRFGLRCSCFRRCCIMFGRAVSPIAFALGI